MNLKRSEVSASDRLHEAVLLIEDIFAASESAITILNDLLNYEHMDSGKGRISSNNLLLYHSNLNWLGNFRMDMAFKPLLRVFEGKMKSAELMAKSKGLEFVVEDKTSVETFLELENTGECEYNII